MKKSNARKVVVIGGGGREHAIAVALKRSEGVELIAIPGNAGIAQIAECVTDIKATEVDKIVQYIASRGDVYLTVVAPDDPLAMGLVDKLEARGLRAFGPRANAAYLEASKAYAKDLMKKYGIPSAGYECFDELNKALKYLQKSKYPIVIKADGLALGKGVVIADNYTEAAKAATEMLEGGRFGSAGHRIVVEEFLTGFEVSVLAFTDGDAVVPMVSSQDHKRAYDGDNGPNTGGMGAYSPSEKYTDVMHRTAMETIFLPTIRAMKTEGREFRGVIYYGLMIGSDGVPKVLEYNARFGDPETQVVLPRLKSDLLQIMEACIDGGLDKVSVEWSDEAAVCVVAASGGYPGDIEKGKEIAIGVMPPKATVYHAGTATDGDKMVTSGGRVLCVSAVGKSMDEARKIAYEGIDKIKFEGMFYRGDIGGSGK